MKNCQLALKNFSDHIWSLLIREFLAVSCYECDIMGLKFVKIICTYYFLIFYIFF